MKRTVRIKKRTFTLLSILVITLLIIGGFFLYRYYRTSICQYCNVYYTSRSTPSAVPTPTPTYEVYPTIPEPANFGESSWKIFTVPGKYTIKYPPSLVLNLNVWNNPPTNDVIFIYYPSERCNIGMTVDSRKGSYDLWADELTSGNPNLEKVSYGFRYHGVDSTCGKKIYVSREHLKKGDVEIDLTYREYVDRPLLFTAIANSLTFVH